MSKETGLLACYNRGCGQKFDPNAEKDGQYAGWIENKIAMLLFFLNENYNCYLRKTIFF